MSRQLPFLALDSNNKRTILNDYSLPMSGGNVTTKKETKMAHIMTNQEVQSHTKKLVARLLGQDSAPDDEAVEKLKGFLKSRLSAEDHEQVCNMLAGGDVEAEDTEPDTIGINPPRPIPGTPRVGGAMVGGAAADAQADFLRRYPNLAGIRQDNSGIQPKRAAGRSNTANFNERFPGLAHIRQA
jgi:hypothetical protein